MKILIRIFGMVLCLLGALPSMANEAGLQDLNSKADRNPYQGHWVYAGKVHEKHLLSFAESGHLPAIVDAAERYLNGNGVEQNLGTAWYWLKRAQQAGIDTSSITPKTLNQLLKDMNDDERWLLAYLANYHDDLDLSEITIPPSFGPLTESVPAPLSDQEVTMFINKFNGLSRKTHSKAYNAVERELFGRTAGMHFFNNISTDGQIRPLGMGKDAFVQRKCNYYRAIEKIFPQGRDIRGEHLRQKDYALASLFQEGAARYVHDVLQTGQLCPNRESEGIIAGLAWAKELEAMATDDLQALATKHFNKSGSANPDRYEPNSNIATPENEFELYMHHKLARTIRKFADLLEQQN